MSKKAFYLIGAFLIMVIVFLVLSRLVSPEDTWVCDNGNWIKHGNPASDKPSGSCGISRQKIQIYFLNQQLNKSSSCEIVYPVEREIDQNLAAQMALLELLKGPSAQEQAEGYYSNINRDIKLNSVEIKGKVAYADFDQELGQGVAGSCNVIAIRTQIAETLKQFSTVSDVVISVDGQIDYILQP